MSTPETPSAASTTDRGRILDGRAIAAAIRADVQRDVEALTARAGRPPGLAVVLVGDDPASHSYVATKARMSKEVGIRAETLERPADISQDDLLALVARLNADDQVDGILVQLPLPDPIDEERVLVAVDPDKDVDGFHPVNVGRLWRGDPRALAPCTPAGILEMLRREGVELQGKRAVVVGRSSIVGKPMAALLLAAHCTVTVCHSRTRDLPAVCREGDILVAAVGYAGLLGGDAVRDGAVVVDVGTNRVDDRATVERLYPNTPERLETFDEKGYILAGDVVFEEARPKASAITPVPGGVGPLTVAMLLSNTLEAFRRREGLGE